MLVHQWVLPILDKPDSTVQPVEYKTKRKNRFKNTILMYFVLAEVKRESVNFCRNETQKQKYCIRIIKKIFCKK